MTITVKVPTDLEPRLREAARTQGKDVGAYLLDNARRQLRPDVLPELEATLLQAINAPVAPEARMRRDTLIALQANRDLTDVERSEMLWAASDVKIANAERWQAIADLATRRGLTLAQIAADLEIPMA